MTRLAALTSTAIAAGLTPEQAEELARNICAQAATAIEDCALAAVEHRIEQDWLAEPACGVARLAEQLAAAWCARDAEVEAVLRRLAAVAEFGGTEPGAFRDALDAAWKVLPPEARAAERLARGCCRCGGALASAADDLCAACAAKVPARDPP